MAVLLKSPDGMLRTATARARAPTQSQAKWGTVGYCRDIHHATADRQTTVCGRDCSEWLYWGEESGNSGSVVDDMDLCKVCRKKLMTATPGA